MKIDAEERPVYGTRKAYLDAEGRSVAAMPPIMLDFHNNHWHASILVKTSSSGFSYKTISMDGESVNELLSAWHAHPEMCMRTWFFYEPARHGGLAAGPAVDLSDLGL